MEATMSISGYVGGEVEFRRTERTNTALATFRLGCTPRVRREGVWTDDPTTWVTVTCWRALAEHVAQSFSKGDPVVVVGRVKTQAWTGTDDQVQTRMVVEATAAGHDLNRGTSTFRRVPRSEAQEVADREAAESGAQPAAEDVRQGEAVPV